MKGLFKVLMSVLTLGALLTGCVSLPNAVNMSPTNMVIKNRSAKSVTLAVEGEPRLDNSETIVQNSEITQALRNAIEKSRLFKSVSDSLSDGYLLEVSIVGYDPPLSGAKMTAVMTTRWRLSRQSGQEVLFEDFLKKSYSCTVGDALNANKRFIMANEGVVRETIAEGVQKISELPL
jgi:hypothetical protein